MKATTIKTMWKTLLLSVAMLNTYAVSAGPNKDSSLTRKENKDFSVGNTVLVDIQNKYGEVIIHTWNEDKVRVEVSITAHGKDKDKAEKMLERVEMQWEKVGDEVRVHTLFDQNTSPMKELWKNITDQATALLNESKIEVDYNIYLPKQAQLLIDNKYGDVYLGDVTGVIEVNLSHGTLQATNLPNQTKLVLNFGNAIIKSLGESYIEVKGGTVDVETVQGLELNSTVSEIHIDEVKELQLNSRNDRIFIDEAAVINGKGLFSKVKMGVLSNGANLDLKYGNFNVDRVKAGFNSVNITSSSTDILLTVEEMAAFDLDVTALQEKLQLPKNNTTALSSSEEGKFTTKKLSVGAIGKQAGKIAINANGGEVDISYVK